MRRANLLSHAARSVLQVILVCIVLAAAQGLAAAQTRPADAGATPSPPSARTDADEEFELNIDERRISEKDFHAATAVETDGVRGLQLGVGVALSAKSIEVLLSNVRGHVRFRASLAPVLRLLEAHRAAPARTPPP